MGLPIGLPLELILLDWTKSNYSQSRAVLEQAYENFLYWQYKLKDFFYQPLFEWKLEQWQSQDNNGKSLVSKNQNFQSDWITPSFPWIDKLKEAQAHAEKVERGFTTHSHVCKSLNVDSAEILAVREKEIRSAIERSKRIEKETGVKVPWEHFAGLKPAKNNTPAFGSSNKEEQEQEGD